MHGHFITFEGGEGCGKSTQSKLLVHALEKAGIACLHTREPGGEEGAEAIRELLVKGATGRWDPVAETLLFLAARVQHVKRVIQPALTEGTWVISDRFHDSTRVYQGVGKGISRSYYDRLHAATLGNFVPDLTLLLDIAPEVGLKRSIARANDETRFEKMDMSFHKAVRDGFLALAKQEPERIAILDASASVELIHHKIMQAVNERFGVLVKVV